MMVKIICVYKTGGWCSSEDVLNLKAMLLKMVNTPFEFVCYSDDPTVATVPLEKSYKGWWSKVEIFKDTGPCIYLDLDTTILCNMKSLISHVHNMDRGILMLKPFYLERNRKRRGRSHQFASGVMAWKGDFSYVFTEFIPDVRRIYAGDQDYIQSKLMSHGEKIEYVNNVQRGIVSYRWHCKKRLPPDAEICCFHGNPRPKKVGMPFWGYHLVYS